MLASHLREKVGKSPATNSIAAIAEQPIMEALRAIKMGRAPGDHYPLQCMPLCSHLNAGSTGIPREEDEFIYSIKIGCIMACIARVMVTSARPF